MARFVSLCCNWRCVSYTRASGNNVLNASTFGDGTVGAPSITFAADLDTARSGTNTVNVVAGWRFGGVVRGGGWDHADDDVHGQRRARHDADVGEGGALTINPLGTGVNGGDIKPDGRCRLTTGGTVSKPGAGGITSGNI